MAFTETVNAGYAAVTCRGIACKKEDKYDRNVTDA